MKYNVIKFKKLKIETHILNINNGFEFTPIEIFYHNYISIKISLIKVCIFIDFIWNGKK